MQDVPGWLKSLRLHKYKLIFSELTYEEMLGLTEQQLEEKNVTKGARHKIIVNIDKLRARQENLVSMEKSIEQEGASGIKQCLNELKAMLSTPMKAFDHDKGTCLAIASGVKVNLIASIASITSIIRCEVADSLSFDAQLSMDANLIRTFSLIRTL